MDIRRAIESSELAYTRNLCLETSQLLLNVTSSRSHGIKSECLKVRVEDPHLYTAIKSSISVVFTGLKYHPNIYY